MNASDIMVSDVITVKSSDTVQEAAGASAAEPNQRHAGLG
jgi:predicted transcriptional regulator